MEDMMARETGIRSYGPGKFHNIIDEYVYEACLNQGTPDEEISHEGFGWYALMRLDAGAVRYIRELVEDEEDELTSDEEELLRCKALIMHENTDGFVGVDWFDSLSEAEKTWKELEEELADDEEPGEEEDDEDVFSDEEMLSGYVISDGRNGGYDVVHEHKHVGHYRSMENALEEIAVYMEQDKFYPNVYYVNDHGNVDLLDGDGNAIKSRV
jgi:hypothetical protein